MAVCKRILSWLLAIVLLVGCVPAGVVQAQSLTETAVASESVQTQSTLEETQQTPAYTALTAATADAESLDHDQLLEGYAYSLFFGGIATFRRLAGDRLTGDEKLIYDALVPVIKQIAAGERTSTVIGLGQTVNTQDAEYVADAPVTFTGTSLDDAALQRILSALLTDLPYELYWYDKVTGARSVSLAPPDGIILHVQMTLAVADNYQGDGEYTVDCSEAQAAAAAAENSAAIVEKYASASDYEKLVGYKDEICALVTYDHTAANTGDFSLDNDPWQLIHVFDGDTATNVVCEGYSKAFMYLCEQTDFAGDVSCITVTGVMGGPHMWNIVTLEGNNYLVDVTNSEPDTVGADGSLFLAGGAGSILNGYTVGDRFYTYVDNAADGTDPDIALWGSDADSILALAAENYTPKTTNIVASGTCGDDLTWTLDDTGILAISGTGIMKDYNPGSAPWYDQHSSIKQAIIECGVTAIGDYAFRNCTSLTSITIPDGVTSIGGAAFEGCSSLTGITIPDGVTSIGNSAFRGCANLTGITIPDGVTSISSYVFIDCTNLTSITIPDSVTSIGMSVFVNCSNLTSITIPDCVTSIGDNAFSDCTGLTSITIPDGVTAIGENTFINCTNLTTITIPDGVTSIGNQAFASCTNLTNLTIPEGVTSIGSGAFSCCASLTTIIIPDSVTFIGGSAFGDCTGLTSITIPDSITSIGESAFSACTSLTSITIPDSVSSIGSYAFSYCTSLTSITIPDSVSSIGSYAFSYCTSLTGITIPDSVTVINDFLFVQCYELSKVTVGDDVTSIGDSAFWCCESLTSITIPDSVTTIGKYAFSGCTGLKDVYYGGTEAQWQQVNISEGNEWLTHATIHYGGEHVHSYTKTVVKPTATTKGYTVYTCACGHSYKDNYTDVLPLNAPIVNIVLDATTGKQVLTWADGGEGIVYEIYRATSKSGKYSKAGTTEETAWTDSSASVGKTYYYKVKAIYAEDPSLSSGYSNIVSKAAKCANPVITVTLKSGKPYISWSKVSGAKKYEIQYSTDGENFKKLTTVTKAYYSHSKATTGNRYFYKVRAVASKSSYNSGYSTVGSCWVTCVKPSVTVKNDPATGYPVLSWSGVSGAGKYEVYRSPAGAAAYEMIGETTGKSYTDKAAAVNIRYDYQVRAMGKQTELNSPMSDKDTAICKVAAPVITVSVNGDGKPVISWTAVEGASSYKVYRSTKSTKSYKTHAKGVLEITDDACTYTDTTVGAGKTYYYKVVAVGEGNESAYSSYKKATGKCAVPTVTVTVDDATGKPVLTWNKVSSAKKYEIRYSTDGGTTWAKKTITTTKTRYTHTGAAVGKQYTYQVRTVGSKSSYNSSYCDCLQVTPKCAMPAVTLKTNAAGKPSLTWKKVEGAAEYWVYYYDREEAYCFITNTTELSFVDAEAYPGLERGYYVVARNANPALHSEWTKTALITATCAAPAVKGKIGSAGKPELTWAPVEGATAYVVYQSTGKSKLGTKVATVTVTGEEEGDFIYTYTKAKKKKTYYYSVIAVNGNLKSAPSTPVKLKATK